MPAPPHRAACDLPALTLLGLSVSATLSSLPAEIGRLRSLRQLAVGAARLTELPVSLCDLHELQTLTLSGNQLRELPASLGDLARLLSLEVADNRLETIPESVGALGALRTLQARDNRLRSIPASVGRLLALRTLGLSGNRLQSLPEELGRCAALEALSAASNELASLPSSICELGSLRRLEVDDNRIRVLPSGLQRLSSLEELGLAHNDLTDVTPLGEGPASMPSLRHLRLESNLLPCVPAAVAGLSLAEPASFHDNPRAPLADVPSDGSERADAPDPTASGGAAAAADDTAAANFGHAPSLPQQPTLSPGLVVSRPTLAILLPGLVRNYEHGQHWRRLVAAQSAIFDVRVFLCVWEVCGDVSNNFAQSADRAAGRRLDVELLRRSYPAATVEVVSLDRWAVTDAAGHDGRYLNQWAMVARCWALMERTLGDAADFVVRSRPDARPACFPRRVARSAPYVALADELWGSDAFFYGDGGSMRAACALAERYDEHTAALGHASSEPMMERHLQQCELQLLRFPRCASIDRT